MDSNLLNGAQLLALIAVAAISAIAASGLTTLALIVFFKNLLGSPAALKLIEGLVDSFPPDTRELINVMARFVETVSENPNPPAAPSLPQPVPNTPPQPTQGTGVAQTLGTWQNPDSSATIGYPPFLLKRLSSKRERVQL